MRFMGLACLSTTQKKTYPPASNRATGGDVFLAGGPGAVQATLVSIVAHQIHCLPSVEECQDLVPIELWDLLYCRRVDTTKDVRQVFFLPGQVVELVVAGGAQNVIKVGRRDFRKAHVELLCRVWLVPVFESHGPDVLDIVVGHGR